jgi:hypothetical protein
MSLSTRITIKNFSISQPLNLWGEGRERQRPARLTKLRARACYKKIRLLTPPRETHPRGFFLGEFLC